MTIAKVAFYVALIAMSSTLPAQSTPALGGARLDMCADTTTAEYRNRMLLVLDYDGPNRREMWMAIDMAASSRIKACVVSRTNAPLPDTSVYGRLTILAHDDGGYEIATALGGTSYERRECRNRRAATVAGGLPILWGVILTHVVGPFVECAFDVRAKQTR